MKEIILFSISFTLLLVFIIIGEINHRRRVKKMKEDYKDSIYVTWSQDDYINK
jgi:hypothetical protein